MVVVVLLHTGIGQATAISFVREGCRKVAIAGQNPAGLAETEQLMRDLVSTSVAGELDIVCHTTDVSQEAEIDALLEKTVRDLGRVDYAVNCAVCNFMTFSLFFSLFSCSSRNRVLMIPNIRLL